MRARSLTNWLGVASVVTALSIVPAGAGALTLSLATDGPAMPGETVLVDLLASGGDPLPLEAGFNLLQLSFELRLGSDLLEYAGPLNLAPSAIGPGLAGPFGAASADYAFASAALLPGSPQTVQLLVEASYCGFDGVGCSVDPGAVVSPPGGARLLTLELRVREDAEVTDPVAVPIDLVLVESAGVVDPVALAGIASTAGASLDVVPVPLPPALILLASGCLWLLARARAVARP